MNYWYFSFECSLLVVRKTSTGRPRANKFDSKLDREQKEKGIYFYV